jgi:hypothetical protein
MVGEARNPITVILLSIITCGIYYYIWMYQINEEMRQNLGDESIESTKELILTIVTCGIFGIYWIYIMGERIQKLMQKKGQQVENEGTMFLIFSLVGLGVVSIYMIQERINRAYA